MQPLFSAATHQVKIFLHKQTEPRIFLTTRPTATLDFQALVPEKSQVIKHLNLTVALFPLSSQVRVLDLSLSLVQAVHGEVFSLRHPDLSNLVLKIKE